MEAAVNDHHDISTAVTVDVNQIKEELERVRWGLHDDQYSEAAEHAAAEARASVLNMITVVSDESQLARIKKVLDGLSITHPSRTLILLAQEHRSGEKLEAEVSAETRSDSGHRVSTEQVILHAHGEVAKHLSSVVTPLLISELPVMLWWPGLPNFESQLFGELCALCDRLVVDTDDGFERRHLRLLLDCAHSGASQTSISDFNWARLVPWRHLTAQFFDMPDMLSRLGEIQGAVIAYGAERPIAQALLLAGWLKSRMGTVGVEVPVEFVEDDSHDHRVARFDLYTGTGPDKARFTVRRIPGGRLAAEIRIGEHDAGSRTVGVPARTYEDLLAIQLTLPAHDVLFEEALAAAME
ncbi:MAG TPA: glucose-6-phosphate dehydrogenase assembly protein OpcA [Candidatus Dormibacteraeota bacterium]|jgi:glucose-6-phosphate dehydrogenase assembly protein OpcA|nr:glucose-6-phosphate dehydrogenase assembly protein OpcA [Candidatus Dormibacteraeota bacterium]